MIFLLGLFNTNSITYFHSIYMKFNIKRPFGNKVTTNTCILISLPEPWLLWDLYAWLFPLVCIYRDNVSRKMLSPVLSVAHWWKSSEYGAAFSSPGWCRFHGCAGTSCMKDLKIQRNYYSVLKIVFFFYFTYNCSYIENHISPVHLTLLHKRLYRTCLHLETLQSLVS